MRTTTQEKTGQAKQYSSLKPTGSPGLSMVSLLNSPFSLVLALALLLNLYVDWANNLKVVKHDEMPPLQLSKSALRFKYAQLKSLPAPPDIALLGSSLLMGVSYYSDEELFPASLKKIMDEENLNAFQAYPQANRLSLLLGEKTGRMPKIFNFSSAACMVSDVHLLLSRMIEAGKKPKTVILGLGLRDFVDNVNPPTGETPSFQSLCSAPYLLAEGERLSGLMKPESFSNLIASTLFPLWRDRDELKLLAEHYLAQTFHRPNSYNRVMKMITEQAKIDAALQAKEAAAKASSPKAVATKSVEAVGTAVKNTQNTKSETQSTQGSSLPTHDYQARYNPPNYERFYEEMGRLADFISLCKKEGIRPILVNMPVSAGNKQISKQSLRAKYLSDLRNLCQTNGVTLLDYEDTQVFGDEDYFDTVHLNQKGSKKFMAIFAEDLAKEGISK